MSPWDDLQALASDATSGLVPDPKRKPAPRSQGDTKALRELHASLVGLYGALCRLDGKLSERAKAK